MDIVEMLRHGPITPQVADQAADEINRLRAGGCARDQGLTQHCAEAETLAREVDRLRAVLQRVRRWGSPMVRGYIDGALGGPDRGGGALADGEDRAVVKQNETA